MPKTKPVMTDPPKTAYQIVPKEPTHDQIEAAYPLLNHSEFSPRVCKELCRSIYLEMLQHAPQPRRGGLTVNQRRVHEVITETIDATNVPPSIREIAKMLGMKSHASAWRPLRALKRKKIIDIGTGQRDITLLKRPEET